MLEIWLSLCRAHGISEILVNAHAHAAAVIDFVRNWKNGVRVTVVEEQALFGSAGSLRANRAWVASEEKFWVFYADVLTSADLSPMLQFHSSREAATLAVYPVPDPERCGIVSVNENQVIVDFLAKARPAEK